MDPILQWALGVIVTVAIAVVGGFIKYLFGVIRAVRDETDQKIAELRADVETKRTETRDYLLELVNTKFDAIWESIRDLKDRIN